MFRQAFSQPEDNDKLQDQNKENSVQFFCVAEFKILDFWKWISIKCKKIIYIILS